MKKKRETSTVLDRNEYSINPVPKPRQTKRDQWQQRPCVMRYRAFADQCRLMKMQISEAGSHIIFIIPMPRSWSKKKKAEIEGKPHKQTPDCDNLLKSVMDSLFKDDSHVYDIRISKFWGFEGKIIIQKI